jgi:hypothetical protein
LYRRSGGHYNKSRSGGGKISTGNLTPSSNLKPIRNIETFTTFYIKTVNKRSIKTNQRIKTAENFVRKHVHLPIFRRVSTALRNKQD